MNERELRNRNVRRVILATLFQLNRCSFSNSKSDQLLLKRDTDHLQFRICSSRERHLSKIKGRASALRSLYFITPSLRRRLARKDVGEPTLRLYLRIRVPFDYLVDVEACIPEVADHLAATKSPRPLQRRALCTIVTIIHSTCSCAVPLVFSDFLLLAAWEECIGDDLRQLRPGGVVVGAEVRQIAGSNARLPHSTACVAAHNAVHRQPLYPDMERVARWHILKALAGGSVGVALGIGDDLGDLSACRVAVGSEVRSIAGSHTRLARPTALVAADDASRGQPLDELVVRAAYGDILEALR